MVDRTVFSSEIMEEATRNIRRFENIIKNDPK